MYTLVGEINKNLEYVYPEIQDKTTTPTKQTQEITPDEDYYGLSKVVVNPIPNEYIIPNYQTKNITITQNGTQNVTPDSNYDGLDKVSIVTAIPEPVYQTKNITIIQNGVQEITPDVNYDGLSKVNVTTSIPAPVLQEKTITPTSQTQNVTPDSNYDGLSKVVVNGVSGYVDWSAIGYSGTPQSVIDGYDYAKQIYDNWDSSQTNLSRKYEANESLIFMPLVDTSNVTSFQYMFDSCTTLTVVPQLDMSNATNIQGMFNYDSLLEDMGGFKNLGQSYLTSRQENYTYYRMNLTDAKKLTHESLMNIINNLYDIASKGCNRQLLILGETNLAKLTEEEIAIATNKGWQVS